MGVGGMGKEEEREGEKNEKREEGVRSSGERPSW